jgi:GNAT superfamily N-acetyltransferase
MARGGSAYTTKDLSKSTWPDFEALFSRGSGWDFCACMAFQRDLVRAPGGMRTRPELKPFHAAQKQELVGRRRAHGVLVYCDGEPIGWCQFGSVDELRIDPWQGERDSGAGEDEGADWRITCFVTDKRHRQRGVAGIALRAALDAIRKRGGGVVEASPIAFFMGNAAAARAAERVVPGVGIVNAAHGSFGNVSHRGTVAMFEDAGFEPVAIHRRTHVVMRRRV